MKVLLGSCFLSSLIFYEFLFLICFHILKNCFYIHFHYKDSHTFMSVYLLYQLPGEPFLSPTVIKLVLHSSKLLLKILTQLLFLGSLSNHKMSKMPPYTTLTDTPCMKLYFIYVNFLCPSSVRLHAPRGNCYLYFISSVYYIAWSLKCFQ